MTDYKLALYVLPDRSNYETEVFIMSRREVDKWNDAFYYNTGGRIKDIFKPAHSDSYAVNITDKTRYKSP